MRSLLVATVLLAAPLAARAEPSLRLESPRFSMRAPAAGLAVPALALGRVTAPDLFDFTGDRGSAAPRQRLEPVLCLVLGIIPGFGIGHLLAGSDRWVTWLVVDILIAVVFWGPFWYWPDHPHYFPAFNVLVLVERIFEGIFAYEAAGGGRVFRLDGRLAEALPSPASKALPMGHSVGLRW